MNNDLICYKQMPVWTADTIPAAFLSRHNTQEGTWGKLRVLEGRLKFYGLDEHDNILSEQELSPDSGIHTIEPQQWHKIEPLGEDLRVQLEFHCDKADYFRKKYGMTATHSAVKAAAATVPPSKTLDLGCGQGRNALYLALKGYDVTAVDQNPNPLYALSDLAAQENLPLQIAGYDINAAALDPRIRATASMTMYDMSHVAREGHFGAANSKEARDEQRRAWAAQRTADYRSGEYPRAGGVVDPLPDDAPDFVRDYHAYYKTLRGYHEHSGNSTDGWNVTGTMSFLNQPLSFSCMARRPTPATSAKGRLSCSTVTTRSS